MRAPSLLACFLVACAVGAATACASGTLGRIGGGSTELPKDLPKDMQERFEIKDVSSVEPSPSPTPSPSPGPSPSPEPGRKRKPLKGKKKPQPLPSASPEPIL